MIRSLGTVFLLGLVNLVSTNDNASYSYKAHFSNPTVISTQLNDVETEDDTYNFSYILSVDFDVYFNAGNVEFLTNNYVFGTQVTRQYRDNSYSYTYNMSYSPSYTYQSYELEDTVIHIKWRFAEDSSACQFYVGFNNGSPHIESTIVTPDEDFISETVLEYDLDLSMLSSQLYTFTSNSIGYSQGFSDGQATGYQNGYNDGQSTGYQTGYTDGYTDASTSDSTAVTIFTGIVEVGLLPVNVFLGILNFEVFGINIGGFVASLMTIAIVVIVLRVVLGSKGSDK